MNIIVNHVPTTSIKRTEIKMTPQYITIHSTGNPSSTAQNERNYLTNPSNKSETGYHYVVDHTQIIECIPPCEVAWHAGDGRGNGNMKSIGIEICESGNREKTLENAIDLVRYLKTKHKIDKVVRHFDWSGKICPSIMYDGGKWTEWQAFYSRCMEKKQEHWAQKSLDEIKGQGLITGDKDPNAIVTWGELATVISRLSEDKRKMRA